MLFQVCNDVQEPRQECKQVPNEVCESKPVTRTRYVDEEECDFVTRQECSPVTRQQCSNVVDRVPRQSSRQVSGRGISVLSVNNCLCSGLQHSL